MAKPKQPHGPAMTLGNMRDLGVQRLLVSCLNHAAELEGTTSATQYDRTVIRGPLACRLVRELKDKGTRWRP